MILRKVTFDTCELDRAVRPDLYRHEHDFDAYVVVHDALRSHKIEGFFSEAVPNLDGLRINDKVDVVSGGRIKSESRATGPSSIEIRIGARWPAASVPSRFQEKIDAALALGLRPLIGPRHLGVGLPLRNLDPASYEPLTTGVAFAAQVARMNDVDRELARHGVGRARAIQLGLAYSARDGVTGEWWAQGLARAQSDAERKKVHQAINEWADGHAIASHVGYENDCFCTRDGGRRAGQQSTLHPTHKSWLQADFGVAFVTLVDLATLLAPNDRKRASRAKDSAA